ncbi:MAG: cell division protein FtsH, partial [Chloroflexi bacterium]|nr:cell division protein FtsH [Chloroflexota bacterium]
EAIFLGREISEERDYSLKTEAIIDREIDRLLREGVETATKILTEHEDRLEAVSSFLLENETIDADQFEAIMEGRDPLAVQGETRDSGDGGDVAEDLEPVGRTEGSSAVDPSPAG